MKIVHTSDWHAGRIWKNVNRLGELESVLDGLAAFIERERVDLLLLTGDVFDNGLPAARAERVVFRFLRRIGKAGAQSVVIAGNHDSDARIEAWGLLAELAGVRAVGRPRAPRDGGVIEIETRAGERAVVAALPFAAPRTLVSAIELAGDDGLPFQTYADKVRRWAGYLCESFRDDAVNLLMLHTHLEGALWTGSERKVHLGDTWAANPQGLPSSAHYVALGHIHRPQEVLGSPSPAHYAGSPMQLDFGEAGEEKSFVFVEAHAGKPARIGRVPYEGAATLAVVQASLQELERRADELRRSGWIKAVVELETPDPDANRKVRALLPNAVAVDVVLPATAAEAPAVASLADHTPREVFSAYFAAKHGRTPEPALVERFDELLAGAEAG